MKYQFESGAVRSREDDREPALDPEPSVRLPTPCLSLFCARFLKLTNSAGKHRPWSHFPPPVALPLVLLLRFSGNFGARQTQKLPCAFTRRDAQASGSPRGVAGYRFTPRCGITDSPSVGNHLHGG